MSSDEISLLREKFGSDTVLIHKDDGAVELPDSLRLAASLRTCGDPECYFPQHLSAYAREVYTLVQASMTEWVNDGCPPIG